MNFYPQLCVVILLFLFVIQCSSQADYEDEDGRPASWARCPWIRNKLKNGRVKIRSRGRIAKFLCNPGYEMVGKRFATCVRGQWNNPIPFCVARGCYKLPEPANGKVTEMYRGALLVYDCLPGYSLQGPVSLYCDGTRWSDAAPICEVSIEQPEASCDFEDPDLCGWTHDPTHDFEWRRNQFGTPSGHVGTGPSYDHTFGKGKAGFYLYLEASSPRKEKDTCRLFSPVFPANYSPGCFTFWYHMYGATTGSLRIYVKPESHLFGELSPTWEKSGDQGNQWLRGEIEIPDYLENFQLIIEGVRGSSYVGDTAIDDISLWPSNCSSVRLLNATSPEASAESCRGRCKEQDDEAASCECTENCIMNNTCCRDYYKICTAGTDNSSMDGETPPNFIVTDYLNAITQSHTSVSQSVSTDILHQSTTPVSSVTERTFSPTDELEETASPVILSISSKSTTPSTTSSSRFTTPASEVTQFQSTLQVTPLSEKTTFLPSTEEIRITTYTPKTPGSTTTPSERPTFMVITTPKATTVPTTKGTTPSTTTTRATTLILIPSSPTGSEVPSSSRVYSTEPSTSSNTLSQQVITSSTKLSTITIGGTTPISKYTLRFPTYTESESTAVTNLRSTESQEMTTAQATTQTPKPEARFTARFPPWMNTAITVAPTTSKIPTSTQLMPVSFFLSTSPKSTSTSTIPPTTATTTTKRTTSISKPSSTLPAQRVTTTTTTKTVTRMSTFEKEMDIRPTLEYKETTDKDSNIPPASSPSKSESSSSPATAAVTICFLLLAAAACGIAYYCYKNRTRRLSKQTEDSEIRFLSDNEVLEFSEGSEKVPYTHSL